MTIKNSPPLRAKPFKATRKHHSIESAEDYTELIYELIEAKGEARTGEIAKQFGISHVTALRTIRRLQEQGYVRTSYHKPIELTDKGRKLALYSNQRHKILLDFLIALGVPRSIAEIDVEGVEHHISKVTLNKIVEFLEKKV